MTVSGWSSEKKALDGNSAESWLLLEECCCERRERRQEPGKGERDPEEQEERGKVRLYGSPECWAVWVTCSKCSQHSRGGCGNGAPSI